MAFWMSDAQQRDYDTVCLLIDGVHTGREFYEVCGAINSGKYDFDAVTSAREDKRFQNSAQYA